MLSAVGYIVYFNLLFRVSTILYTVGHYVRGSFLFCGVLMLGGGGRFPSTGTSGGHGLQQVT